MAKERVGNMDEEEGVNEVVDIQIESGSKIMTSIGCPIFILASSWPSWGFAAKACGCKNLYLCLWDGDTDLDLDLENVLLPREKCFSLSDWKHKLRDMVMNSELNNVVVLLQVSANRASATWHWIQSLRLDRSMEKRLIVAHVDVPEDTITDRTCGSIRECPGRHLVQLVSTGIVEVSHSLVGGVLDQAWTFWINRQLSKEEVEEARHQSKVEAELGDILSTTIRGEVCHAPADRKPNGVCRWREEKGRAMAKCVFSPTGWVKRDMTIDKMMDVYDIQRKDRVAMMGIWGENTNSWPRPFTRQIPVRVLVRYLEAVVLPRIVMKKNGREMREEAQGDRDVKRLKNMVEKGESTLSREEAIVRDFRKNEIRHEEPTSSTVNAKLEAKNDDAQARVEEWDRRACQHLNVEVDWEQAQRACNLMRCAMLRRYRHFRYGVIRSFRRFMLAKHGKDWMIDVRREARKRRGRKEVEKDYDVGMDAIHRALKATFWEWEDGSTLFFWRWPEELQADLRDGMQVWYKKRDLPSFWGRQRWPQDVSEKAQLKEKIGKVLARHYITDGYVSSLTGFFAVPKGVDDIRVVYDATKSGLNDAIWAPNFYLPTINSVVAKADDKTYFGDIDVGEMFLNYFLDPRLCPKKAGVDVTELANQFNVKLKEGQRWILRWERSLMGVRSSPFNCVRVYLLGEEVIRGDRHATSNPFRWDHVVMNLPGTKNYDPTKPWLMLYDSKNKRLAAFVISYVDDLRTGSQGKRGDGDKVVHHVACCLNYLGQQDAARKRGFASRSPGAWAGAVVEAEFNDGIYVTVAQDKWDKVRCILKRYTVSDERDVKKDPVWLDRKTLERDVGFLVHVFMTYENLRPFLKGFYLTLNGWRNDRDEEGWKRSRQEMEEEAALYLLDEEEFWEHSADSGEGPNQVKMVDRLKRDVEVLACSFDAAKPTRRLVRGNRIARVLYGFGDASGAGFGASWTEPKVAQEPSTERKVRYRFGRWGSDTEGASSNYRELRNLVEVLEEMGNKGELRGVEVFLFTDNSTTEAAFSRGSSGNKTLFELVKRVKLLEMRNHARIHIIHVAGKRMIVQGTDGLSRGVLSEGVMGGDDMNSFIPLHKTALERSQGLLGWIKECCDLPGVEEFVCLSTEEWFERGHDVIGGEMNVDGVWIPRTATGCYIWAPPPCVALQCLEELRKARHKRQKSSHVFVCPRVMTTEWQRHLLRSADIVIYIPPGHQVWSTCQHEPLLLGLYFPFLKYEPWQLKNSPRVLDMGRRLQQVCKADPMSSGRLLRQLWQFARKLHTMPEDVVFRMLHRANDTEVPTSAPRKRRRTALHGRIVDERRSGDLLNLALIRRVSLDVFWAKEASTVAGLYRTFEHGLQSALHLGLQPGFLRTRTPWPLNDQVGFGEAMLILWQSLQRGKTSATHQQFDSIRKLRSLASNVAAARPQPSMDGISFRDKGKILSLNKSGVDSALFERFIKGCEKRMGRIVRQDMGLSVGILLAILANLESALRDQQIGKARQRQIVMLGASLVIGFCNALQGNEIFLVEASHLCQYADKGRNHCPPHVVIPLMGRFKGETGERNVMRVLARSTKSGIQIGKWVDRLVKILIAEGRNDLNAPGPAFCDERGFVLMSGKVNEWFHAELIKVQEAQPDLIHNEVDVTEVYNIHRSLRRGATSRASELNYTETMMNLNNRWRKTQTNKGKGGLQKMSQLYVEVSLVMKNLIAFSASL